MIMYVSVNLKNDVCICFMFSKAHEEGGKESKTLILFFSLMKVIICRKNLVLSV